MRKFEEILSSWCSGRSIAEIRVTRAFRSGTHLDMALRTGSSDSWPSRGHSLFRSPQRESGLRLHPVLGVAWGVLVLALFVAGEFYVRSTGAIDTAVRVANAQSTILHYEAMPFGSLASFWASDGRVYVEIRVHGSRPGRRQLWPHTDRVPLMRLPEGAWVPEEDPRYIP